MNIYLENAFRLAWIDTKVRYKKSYLGPFWYTVSNFFGIVALSVVWADLVKEDLAVFVPKVAIGLVLWQLIAGVLTESPRLLNDNSAVVKNIKLPIWFLPFRLLFRQLINLAHNLILIAAILLYFRINPFSKPLALAMGLVCTCCLLFFIAFILAGLGARYRDIRYGIETLMPLLFFVSPVVFKADSLSSNLVNLNPLTPMIEIVRLPILGISPSISMYVTTLVCFILVIPLSVLYYKAAARNLSFWVH
jgi:ABC-type polysaccharide/polyol phosphate export permease